MQLTDEEYDTLYTNIEREIKKREILYQSLRTTTAKKHIQEITKAMFSQQNNALKNTPANSHVRAITYLAVRCNHNATRRMRLQQSRLQPNSNTQNARQDKHQHDKTVPNGLKPSSSASITPKISTILVANTTEQDHLLIGTNQLLSVHNDLPTGKNISVLDYRLFLQILKKEIGFKGSCSGIYYYTKALDRQTRVQISTEVRQHSALQDTIASKINRATFVVKPLI